MFGVVCSCQSIRFCPERLAIIVSRDQLLMPDAQQARHNRIAVILTISLGGAAALYAARGLRPSSGEALFTMFRGGDLALGSLVAFTLVLIVLGVVSWALARRGAIIAALTAICGALLWPAIASGPIDPYLLTHALPGAYAWLAAEAMLWAGFTVVWLALIHRATQHQSHNRLAVDVGARPALSIAAGLLCAAIAGGIVFLGLQSTNVGQAIGAILGGFFVGSLVARVVIPEAALGPTLLAPSVLAVLGYLPIVLLFDQTESVLTAWFQRESVMRLGYALPIVYLAAGGLGVAWGTAVAHALEETPEPIDHLEPSDSTSGDQGTTQDRPTPPAAPNTLAATG